MVAHKNNFFNMDEIIVVLALIAFLLVLMIGFNKFLGNNYNIAAEKFMQTDILLKKWAYTTKSIKLKDSNIMASSIAEYLNKETNIKARKIKSTDNTDEIHLNNGITLSVKLLNNNKKQYLQPVYNSYKYNMNEKNIAIISAKIRIKHQDYLEEYFLRNSRLVSLSNLYEGWEKYPIETITTKEGKTLKVYCAGLKHCKKGCTDEDTCDVINSKGNYVYINTVTSTPCINNRIGSIVKQQIGTVEGVVELNIDKCCNSPMEYVGGKQKCACPDTFIPKEGYIYNKNSLTCQTPCLKGTYFRNGQCVACDKNHYCPNDAMTFPIKCPKNTCGKKKGLVLEKDACTPCNK